MFTDRDFLAWCVQTNATESARQIIEDIRTSPPSRRVQSRRGNVPGRYPSRKMGVTIQFESHTVELWAIYWMEHNPDVLAYYDQPTSFRIHYHSAKGRKNQADHTADFFAIRQHSAGWEELKAKSDLITLGNEKPEWYRFRSDTWQWEHVWMHVPVGNISHLQKPTCCLLKVIPIGDILREKPTGEERWVKFTTKKS